MVSQANLTREADYPLEYEFVGNQYDYTFSHQGAIYSLDHYTSHYPQYMRFARNEYNNIYCLDSCIMRAEVLGSGDTSTVSIHNYTDEKLF